MTKLCQERLRTGADMNDKLRAHKDFRNPSIYEKLIQFCDIDEFGTNYPPVRVVAGRGSDQCQKPRWVRDLRLVNVAAAMSECSWSLWL